MLRRNEGGDIGVGMKRMGEFEVFGFVKEVVEKLVIRLGVEIDGGGGDR